MNIISHYIKMLTVILIITVQITSNKMICYAEESVDGQIMVSLGDSYSSGEGIPPFYGQYDNISQKVNNTDWLAHRSKKAWSGMLSLPSVKGTMSKHRNKNWFFVAASGAVTKDLLHECVDKKAHQEIMHVGVYDTDKSLNLKPQLDVFQELNGRKADYVTLTLGGNDAGFVDIIKKCVARGCLSKTPPFSFVSDYISPGELVDSLNHTWEHFFEEGGIRDNLYSAYYNIENRAGRQAQIIVAGYPRLLDPDGGFMITKEEASIVNDNVSKFNSEIEKIVKYCQSQGMKISFVSVEEEFEQHAAYSDDPFINSVIYHRMPEDLNNPLFPPVSAYSMHPNKKGARAYARCIQKKINEIENNKTEIFNNDIYISVYDSKDKLYDNYTIDIKGKKFNGLFKTGLFTTDFSKTIKVNTTKEIKVNLPKGDYDFTLTDNADGKSFFVKKIKIRGNSKNSKLSIHTMLRADNELGMDIIEGENESDDSDSIRQIPSKAVEYNGHFYYLYSGGIASTYEEATTYCKEKGGYLATLTSKEENDFVYSYIKNMDCENAYFGLSDSKIEGRWEWVTGENSSFMNWHYGEPSAENQNEDYAMFYAQFTDGSWNDGDFGESTWNSGNAFICEWGEYSQYELQTNNKGGLSKDRNLILTLDVSGSMDGTPLDETKKASNNFINTILKENANIGVVTYDNTSEIAAGLSEKEEDLQSIVERLNAGGGTNIEAGLRDASWMLEKTDAQKKIIVLMSDGEPNEGLEGEELIAFAEEIKKKGIRIFTIGFFDSLDDRSNAQYLMEHIASDGCHYEVANADDLVFFFGDMADQINGQKYIYVRIACPVDVSVTYNGETLNSSEENMSLRASFGTLTFEESIDEFGENVDERVKVLRLKEGTDYVLSLNGTGHGIMNYTIGFMDDNGEYSDLRQFKDIKITKKTIIDTVASNTDQSTLNIDQDGDGKYDLRLRAQNNGIAKEVPFIENNWIKFIVPAVAIFVLIDTLVIILSMRRKKKGR